VKSLIAKFGKIFALLLAAGAIYLVASQKHAQREEIRKAPVTLTTNCAAKLQRYALASGERYSSPYVVQRTGTNITLRGYSDEDVRAIQRGCNIIDDTQGFQAKDVGAERWHTKRYIRGDHLNCTNCHMSVGDKQDAQGNRLKGTLHLGTSWAMADMYDRFTGLLLPFELRQMQCFINSSNGYKPNIADDVIRDVTAYSRFLSAAVDLKIGNHYDEQGIDEIAASHTDKQGDDYVRGEALFKQKCIMCHGPAAAGRVVNGRLIAPAIAGPDSWNMQSRNYFNYVSTILPGFICRNMPLGQEGTLTNQECRDIGYYIGNLPRPAGDKMGPLIALKQQVLMRTLPSILRFMDPAHGDEPTQQRSESTPQHTAERAQ
jgi:thiosulfate dehydrogenase